MNGTRKAEACASSPFSRFYAYLELVRLPNIFTAMADVVMGMLFVREVFHPGDGWVLGLLVAASSSLYAAGTVLNDVFDYQVDLHRRPERPLPSGRISLTAACRLGGALLVLGAASAWTGAFLVGHIRPGVVAVLLVGCILLYDAWCKRTPLGPVAMGGCRMLNVLLGMSVAAAAWRAEHWLVAGGIGIYVVGVTWFARTEAQRSSRPHLAAATAVMMVGIGLLAWLPSWTDDVVPLLRLDPGRWHLMLLILGMLIGWRCVWAIIEPSPRMVQTAVKQCILSLVVLDAVACFAVRGVFGAVMIALLLVPTMILGQWIHST